MPDTPGDVIREALVYAMDRDGYPEALAALRQLEADNVSLRALVEGESNTIDERDDAWTRLAEAERMLERERLVTRALNDDVTALMADLAGAKAEIEQLKPHDHTWENRRVNDSIGIRPVCSECGVIRASFYMDRGAADA